MAGDVLEAAIVGALLLAGWLATLEMAYRAGRNDGDTEGSQRQYEQDCGCKRYRKSDGTVISLRPLSPTEGDGYTSQGCT